MIRWNAEAALKCYQQLDEAPLLRGRGNFLIEVADQSDANAIGTDPVQSRRHAGRRLVGPPLGKL
jgi:hypothetical protein